MDAPDLEPDLGDAPGAVPPDEHDPAFDYDLDEEPADPGGWEDLPVFRFEDAVRRWRGSGRVVAAVGHKGSGKTRALLHLLYALHAAHFVQQAEAVSPTDVRTGVFTRRSNLIHPLFLHDLWDDDVPPEEVSERTGRRAEDRRGPAERWLDRVYTERRAAMEAAGRGDGMPPRTKLVVVDDAGAMARLMRSRAEPLAMMGANCRHMALILAVALQDLMQVGPGVRRQIDLFVITRETSGECLEILYRAVAKGRMDARTFLGLMDAVCLKGRRALVIDMAAQGVLYQMELDPPTHRVPRPIGARWYLETADAVMRDRHVGNRRGVEAISAAAGRVQGRRRRLPGPAR